MLILGIDLAVDPSLLRTWSGDAGLGCDRLEHGADLKYAFGRVDELTGDLADLEVPSPTKTAFYLMSGEKNSARPLISLRNGRRASPIFVEIQIKQVQVFLSCAESPDATDGVETLSVFLRIAPAMIFVRYSAGERGWHSLHHYANFTIDDPWLRQPYGYVDYKGLLLEMERHNFHTTIAFIPWNYDRSEPQVISLFRNHADRFSIAIHGNNHDHKEFTDYESKPLAVQTNDLKQALVRMESFRARTGIPYDKVMIFPHSIGPLNTLGALKRYNYLATINSMNVPQDTANPSAPSFSLRPVTLSFAGFPSITRYPVAVPIPKYLIAITQFLDNPLLLYGHSDFFASGIGAFDHIADEVNELEPATEWRSLGEIVRHLYVLKLRDDSDYDVLAFSNNFCLENTAGRNSNFYVGKQEIGGQTIEFVSVDGSVYPYTLRKGQISLVVAIPLGGTRCVAIQYANDLQSGSIDASHDSFFVYLLREGSDFRDIYLAKSGVGLAAIRFYNEHRLKPAKVVGCLLLLLVALIYVSWRLSMSVRRRFRSSHGLSMLPHNLNRRP
jgi:hypothetical protein